MLVILISYQKSRNKYATNIENICINNVFHFHSLGILEQVDKQVRKNVPNIIVVVEPVVTELVEVSKPPLGFLALLLSSVLISS